MNVDESLYEDSKLELHAGDSLGNGDRTRVYDYFFEAIPKYMSKPNNVGFVAEEDNALFEEPIVLDTGMATVKASPFKACPPFYYLLLILAGWVCWRRYAQGCLRIRCGEAETHGTFKHICGCMATRVDIFMSSLSPRG